MKCNRYLPRICAVLLASSLVLSGCGGEESNALQVVVANSLVNEEALTAYSDAMLAANPDWAEGDSAVEFTSLSLGSEEADPAAYGASIMKVSAMVASNEIDVMICDLENAARNARSEMYLSLDEIFTEEELAEYSDLALTFDMVDDEGNPTGEQTPACGLALTGTESLSDIYGESEYGVFIVANTQNPDLAKDVMVQILNS